MLYNALVCHYFSGGGGMLNNHHTNKNVSELFLPGYKESTFFYSLISVNIGTRISHRIPWIQFPKTKSHKQFNNLNPISMDSLSIYFCLCI